MPTATSRHSFLDCYEAFDKALEAELGIKLKFDNEGDATHMRTRLHTARKVDRRDSKVTYESDHPSYGRSPYDPLVVKLRREGDFFYVLIEKIQLAMEVEEISPSDKMQKVRPPEATPLRELVPALEPIRRRS